MRVPQYIWELKSKAFTSYLERQGAQFLSRTNYTELLRFRSPDGQTGVVYINGRGFCTLTLAAPAAWEDFTTNSPWRLAQTTPKIHSRAKAQIIHALLLRDGDTCCFCDQPLAGEQSIEHGLDRSNGGTDHLSNLMLAHKDCNSKAANVKNLRAKIEYIVALRSAQGADPHPKEI